MRFEKIDGIQHVILEENDKLCLTTSTALGNGAIAIEKEGDKLNIFGDAVLVNKISGEGMLEKVYMTPVLSSEEIIEKCDKWLEMFKKVHDVFRGLVLTDKYRKQSVAMELSFKEFHTFNSDAKYKSINLDLVQYGNVIQEGMTISVDDKNSDIYQYLVANVLEYYISKNLVNTEIEQGFNSNNILYSNYKPLRVEMVPMLANLSLLYESEDDAKIVRSLLGCHNLGVSMEQVISNLRNKISNQQLSDKTDYSIDYSTRQYKHVIANLNDKKGPVLRKK